MPQLWDQLEKGINSMKVECEVNYVELESDRGPANGVRVTCGRCGHETESLGTSGRSIRRCMAMLKENCPKGENNYYVAEDDLDQGD